jgi:hypothetical protein
MEALMRLVPYLAGFGVFFGVLLAMKYFIFGVSEGFGQGFAYGFIFSFVLFGLATSWGKDLS